MTLETIPNVFINSKTNFCLLIGNWKFFCQGTNQTWIKSSPKNKMLNLCLKKKCIQGLKFGVLIDTFVHVNVLYLLALLVSFRNNLVNSGR